jgi:hypothetical protein
VPVKSNFIQQQTLRVLHEFGQKLPVRPFASFTPLTIQPRSMAFGILIYMFSGEFDFVRMFTVTPNAQEAKVLEISSINKYLTHGTRHMSYFNFILLFEMFFYTYIYIY